MSSQYTYTHGKTGREAREPCAMVRKTYIVFGLLVVELAANVDRGDSRGLRTGGT